MKKLTKLEINPEKVMTNEELVTLRGGSDNPCGSGQAWNCTVTVCTTCTPYTGIACGTQDMIETWADQQRSLFPEFQIDCTGIQVWEPMPIGTVPLNQY